MPRVIRITTPQAVYEIAAEIVVLNRTKYYAQADGFATNSKEWQEEWNAAFDDEFTLIDWMLNNMDWNDVKKHVIKVKDIEPKEWWSAVSSDDCEVKEVKNERRV